MWLGLFCVICVCVVCVCVFFGRGRVPSGYSALSGSVRKDWEGLDGPANASWWRWVV